jgi:dihydropteroate synthase
MREDSELVHTPISIDTYSARVAAAAAAEGADVINDISGGAVDPEMLPTAAALGLPIVLMHMRGDMDTMWSQESTTYGTSVALEVGAVRDCVCVCVCVRARARTHTGRAGGLGAA